MAEYRGKQIRARERNPECWSVKARDWSHIAAVTLNPERDSVVAAASCREDIQPSAAWPRRQVTRRLTRTGHFDSKRAIVGARRLGARPVAVVAATFICLGNSIRIAQVARQLAGQGVNLPAENRSENSDSQG